MSLRGTKPRYNDVTINQIFVNIPELTRQGVDDEKSGVAVEVIFCVSVGSCCIRRGRIGYVGQPNSIIPVIREQVIQSLALLPCCSRGITNHQ